MKKLLAQKGLEATSFITFSILVEIWMYVSMYQKVPLFFFLELIILIIFASIIFLFKSIIFDTIYLSILFVPLTVLAVLQINYYRMFSDILSTTYIYLLKTGIGGLMSEYPFELKSIIIGVIFIVLFEASLLTINFLKKWRHPEITYSTYYKRIFAPSFSLFTLVLLTYSMNITYFTNVDITKNNNITANNVVVSKSFNFSRYGMLSYYYKELFDDFRIDDITLAQYIESGKNNNADENEFTGLLKNYNVISIMIETGSQYMVNPTLTPTLYKMQEEGLDFNINYSKNKTNISELIGIIGSKPTSFDPWSSLAINNSYPYSSANILKQNDYNTFFIHDTGGDKDIYDRKNFNAKLGFDTLYFHEDLYPDTPIWNWGGNYPADLDTEQNIERLLNVDTLKEKPFYLFWTTLSMHGPYSGSETNKYMKELYYDELKDAEEKGFWTNPLKDDTSEIRKRGMEYYQMASMNFDRSVEHLLSYLKANNLFENTLIVMYGDHEVYYSCDGKDLNLALSGHEERDYPDIYKTFMNFYNPTLNEKIIEVYNKNTVDKFISPYNLVPTMLDILGVDYNSSMYPAKSVFSKKFQENGDIFYSYELSCSFDEKYWSSDNISINKTLIESTQESKTKFNENLSQRMVFQSIIDTIYESNYFSSNSLF